jgi:hypothetical protein
MAQKKWAMGFRCRPTPEMDWGLYISYRGLSGIRLSIPPPPKQQKRSYGNAVTP